MLKEKFELYASQFVPGAAVDSKYLVYSIEQHPGLRLGAQSYVGGLADRFKGIVTAFLVAVATNRIFIMDWRNPFTLEPTISHAQWDWRPNSWRKDLILNHSLIQFNLIDQLKLISDRPVEEIEDKIFLGQKIVVLNINGFSWDFAQRLFPGYHALRIYKEAFEFLFKFTLPEEFNDFWATLENSREDARQLVGIHYRTGGTNNGWADEPLADWKLAERHVREGLKKAAEMGANKPTVYFATDSADAKEAVRWTNFGVPLLVSDFEIGHVERSKFDNRRPFDFAIVEFFALSRCDYIIGGKGAYWSTAAMIGGRKMAMIE